MQAETRIQINVVSWWALACHGYKLDARLMHHSPNGGKRGKIEASIFKGMAVRAGWPDLVLMSPFRRDGQIVVPGLLIEIKAPDGRLNPNQKEMIPLLQQQGYAVVCCWSFDEAVGAITRYLKTGNPLKLS